MRARPIFAALALASATALIVAAPAAAAPTTGDDVTVGGTTWSFYGFTSENVPALDNAERGDWLGGSSSFDDGLSPVYLRDDADEITDTESLFCASDGDLSTATDGTGDEIATCELEPFRSGTDQLEATFELRFFADGETVRSRLIVTNDNDVTVSGAVVGFFDNYYQDEDTRLGASSSAGYPAAEGSVVEDGDVQWVIYDAIEEDDYEVPVIFTAAGVADSASTPVMSYRAGNGQDYQETLYALPDLAPGDSVEVVKFAVWNFFEFELDETSEDVTGDVAGDTAEESSADDSAAGDSTSGDSPAEASTESDDRAVVEVETPEGTKSAFLDPAALFVPAALVAVGESWADRGRFDSLSERDAAGIADPTAVVNWVAVEEEELAETGAGDQLVPFAFLALLLVTVGGAAAMIRRRTV